MQGHAVGDGAHGVLPDAEVQVVAAVVPGAIVPAVVQAGPGGGGQVRRAAHESVDALGDGVHHLARGCSGGDGLVPGTEQAVQLPVPPLRQCPGQVLLEPLGLIGVGPSVRLQPGLPLLVVPPAPVLGLAEVAQGLVGDGEGLLVGPAQALPGQPHLLLAQGLPVDRAGARLVGAPVADDGGADDEAGPLPLRLGRPDGGVHGCGIEAVDGPGHMPAVGPEALAHVFGEGDVSIALDGDAVVVVEVDELAQAQGARQRRRLGGDPLLQVSVGDEGVGEVVDELVVRPVVVGGEPPLGHGQANPIGEPLAQGPRGRLHAGGEVVLRVAGGLAPPLAEGLELLQGHVVAGEVEQGVQERRRVPRGEDEPVPVGPVGVARVVLEEPVPQHVGHGGGAHGRSRVAGVGLLDGIHRQHPHGVDAQLVQRGGSRHGASISVGWRIVTGPGPFLLVRCEGAADGCAPRRAYSKVGDSRKRRGRRRSD